MTLIKSKTSGEIWKKSINAVYTNGKIIKDEGEDLKELLNVILEVDNPDQSDKIIKKFGDQKMIDWMHNNFLETRPINDWGYSYGQRLFDYNGLDQINIVTNKLSKNPDSKSATISLMDPSKDASHVPCITVLDFKLRNGVLYTSSFFRSQDAGKKLYADIISINEISEKIANALKVKIGKLTIFVASLHLYIKDYNKFKKLINK